MKILDDVSEEETQSLEIATGVPLVYELDESMQPIRHFHVGYCTFNTIHLFANTAVHTAHSGLVLQTRLCCTQFVELQLYCSFGAHVGLPSVNLFEAASIALHLCAPLFLQLAC